MNLLEQREAEAKQATAAQQAMLEAKAEEVNKLDAKIAEMQGKLGQKVTGGGTLDQLAALVDQKEQQARELEQLRQKAEQEKRDREAEIERLKQKEQADRKTAFDADLAKYLKVRDSQYVTAELKQQAWEAMCQKWGVTPVSREPGTLYWEDNRATDETASQRAEREKQQEISTLLAMAKDNPWVNSLGMKFVPVPGTEVLFCVWETRVKDYAAYAAATSGVDGSWKDPVYAGQKVTPTEDCPVVNVSWKDAQSFCAWLTKQERAAGKLSGSQSYRLPADWEWSVAVGLNESRNGTPQDKSMKIPDVYPWGTQWPPPNRPGNYDDYSASKIPGFADGYERTAPVGSFAASRHGLYDLGGNAWEWCEDYYDGRSGSRVLRGASCYGYVSGDLQSSGRGGNVAGGRINYVGFRCVLVVGSAAR